MTTGTDAVIRKNAANIFDISLAENGDILTESFLDTSIITSLFSDGRATPAQVPEGQRRRGWIGDENNQDGFKSGSLIWLYEQERLTTNTLNGVATAARNALQWLIDDNIAIDVEARSFPSNGGIRLEVTIVRPSSRVEKRFFELWQNTATGLSN